MNEWMYVCMNEWMDVCVRLVLGAWVLLNFFKSPSEYSRGLHSRAILNFLSSGLSFRKTSLLSLSFLVLNFLV